MSKRFGVTLTLLALMVLLAASCNKKNNDEPEVSNKPKYIATGDEGSITGVVKFDGVPPERKKLNMEQDSNCLSTGGDALNNDLLIDAGKLQNVFVYMKSASLDNYSFDIPSEPVVLDQKGCLYEPRVLGLQVGQTLEVRNSDQTTHNVHAKPKINDDWNLPQTANAPPILRKFKKPETLIPIQCNQHPWMYAQVGVLAHPFYAVSAKDGSYSIKGLPPGTYTLIAYHEVLGEKTQTIQIGAKEKKTQDFSYSSASAVVPTSLQVEPALIVP